jgi:hypothetical protein
VLPGHVTGRVRVRPARPAGPCGAAPLGLSGAEPGEITFHWFVAGEARTTSTIKPSMPLGRHETGAQPPCPTRENPRRKRRSPTHVEPPRPSSRIRQQSSIGTSGPFSERGHPNGPACQALPEYCGRTSCVSIQRPCSGSKRSRRGELRQLTGIGISYMLMGETGADFDHPEIERPPEGRDLVPGGPTRDIRLPRRCWGRPTPPGRSDRATQRSGSGRPSNRLGPPGQTAQRSESRAAMWALG